MDKKIRTTGGNSPIIVVCNQIDINKGFGFDNEFELKKEFPQIREFIKISCKDNEGIDKLKDALEKHIPESELFHTEIDERWLSLKEILQSETSQANFIDETKFRQFCKENQLENYSEHQNAINFLHDLGIVLHFEDTIDMKDYYVLDPYWITYGVYQILTSKYVGEQKGKIEMDKLGYILNEEEDKKDTYKVANYRKIEYTIPQRRFLVDILNQFKLSFYLPGKSHFIVPDLLDTKEPIHLIEKFDQTKDKIQFIYKYDYLPKSVIPNLMVELNKIIKENWRTGCIVENEGSQALITSYDDKLSINVIGDHKKKREFLSVIRYVIDSINIKLNDEPTKLIPLPNTTEFVEYEELLEREKDGDKNYKIYKPKIEFVISDLLEGISNLDDKSESLIIIEKLNDLKRDTQKIINNLDSQYEYLISRLGNSEFEGELIKSLSSINKISQANLTVDIFNALSLFDVSIDEKLSTLYTDLKKSDNIEAKIKFGIPLLHILTGIDLEVKFDVKKWGEGMYKKYKLDIFKRMGYIG